MVMATSRVGSYEQLPYPLRIALRNVPTAWKHGFCWLQYTSLLFTRSYRGLIRALNWWDAIDEHFYLGGALMFDDVERLQRQGVRAVVNLCAERHDDERRLDQADMVYLWLPVLDMCAPSFEQIEHGLRWIQRQLQVGHIIYIHCAAGVGRSATLLACWYVYHQGMSAAGAMQHIKAKHPQVALTRRQLHRLQAFAKSLQSHPDKHC